MSVTGPSTLKERIAALQQRGTSPQPTSPPRSQTPTGSVKTTGGLRDKIARFEKKGGTPIPRGSFGLGAPPQQTGKRNNELWGNRIPSARRTPSDNNTGSLSRSATLSANFPGRTRRVSTSDVQLGGLQSMRKDMEALSAGQVMVYEEGRSKDSEMISSLDIATRTPTSPSFGGRSFTQPVNQSSCPPEESTVISRKRDHTVSGIEAPREVPSALNSPAPIADLDKPGTPQTAPGRSETIVPANDAAGDSYLTDAPLRAPENIQIPTIIEEQSPPSSVDTSQLEIPLPLDVRPAEMALVQEDVTLELPEPTIITGEAPLTETEYSPPVPCDGLAASSSSFDSLNTVDTARMEVPQHDDKPSGNPLALEDDVTALAETNSPSQVLSSSISKLQEEHSPPSTPPPLAYDSSSIPSSKVDASADVASGSHPTTVHPDHPQQSATPAFVSIDSSTTLNSFSNLPVEPHNLTVAEPGSYTLTSSSERPLSTVSTSVSETSSDSQPHVSPILDAFPAVPRYLPSTSVLPRAHTVHSHRAAADRSSTSSIKSTPSLSFSSTSSSSTCSPTATSSVSSQPLPDTRRPAVAVQRSKSQSRPISSVPAWYDDDSDDGEAGWANVVVTRRYY